MYQMKEPKTDRYTLISDWMQIIAIPAKGNKRMKLNEIKQRQRKRERNWAQTDISECGKQKDCKSLA